MPHSTSVAQNADQPNRQTQQPPTLISFNAISVFHNEFFIKKRKNDIKDKYFTLDDSWVSF